MARYETYTDPDPEARKEKARKDLKQWLGPKIWATAHAEPLISELKAMSREQFLFNISIFLGAEGYPVEVWADDLGIAPHPANDPEV